MLLAFDKCLIIYSTDVPYWGIISKIEKTDLPTNLCLSGRRSGKDKNLDVQASVFRPKVDAVFTCGDEKNCGHKNEELFPAGLSSDQPEWHRQDH